MTTLAELDQTLEKFAKSRELLKEVFSESKKYFDLLRAIISNDFVRSDLREEDTLLFLSKNDESYLDKVVNTEPVVILSGQTNSGKSSLLNELLGGSYFPTKAIPCTARIVHVRYSEKNYLQLFTHDRERSLCEKIYFPKKKVPEDKIVLDFKSRTDKEQVECLVEVGLNHELLRHGLQIYDVPGLGENAALDQIVQECLDGMLQLLIYVIDGKTSLRMQDSNFLVYIKTLAPSMRIIYVCNKVEDDKFARQIDRFSDEEPDEPTHIPDRAVMAFEKLKKANLLLQSLEYREDLEMFHGLSCTSIRSARMKKVQNEYTRKFQQFKTSLYRSFSQCVDTHLNHAVKGLLACQRRLFDFFISDKIKQMPGNELLHTVDAVKKREEKIYDNMKELLNRKWPGMVEDMLKRTLEREESSILFAVKDLEFQPITLNETSDTNHVIEMCRLQVRDYVLMLVIEKVEVDINCVEDWFNQEVKNFHHILQPAKADNRVDDILQSHLAAIWRRDEMNFEIGKLKDIWVAGLRQSVKTKLKQLAEDVAFRVKGIYLNEKWKRETASAVLRSINPRSLTNYIVEAIDGKLTSDHNNFLFAMSQIKGLCQLKDRQARSHRKELSKMIPGYGRNLCVTEAVASTLQHGNVTPGKKIGQGSRMVVFDCPMWNGFVEMVVKISQDENFPNEDFSTLFCYTRLLPEEHFKGKVAAVAYDGDWRFCVILPKYDFTLYELLCGKGALPLEKRVAICLDIVDNCRRCIEYGVRLNDLRLNNFLIKIEEGKASVCANLSKWKSLEAPYPDGEPPFHFAPEVHLAVSVNPKTFDAYSIAILFVLMMVGKFVRPKFAENGLKVEELYSQGKDDIVICLRREFLSLFEENWQEAKGSDFHRMILALIKKYIGVKPSERLDIFQLTHDISHVKTRLKDKYVLCGSDDRSELALKSSQQSAEEGAESELDDIDKDSVVGEDSADRKDEFTRESKKLRTGNEPADKIGESDHSCIPVVGTLCQSGDSTVTTDLEITNITESVAQTDEPMLEECIKEIEEPNNAVGHTDRNGTTVPHCIQSFPGYAVRSLPDSYSDSQNNDPRAIKSWCGKSDDDRQSVESIPLSMIRNTEKQTLNFMESASQQPGISGTTSSVDPASGHAENSTKTEAQLLESERTQRINSKACCAV